MSEAYRESLVDLLRRANASTVPSGILHTSAWTFHSVERHDGLNEEDFLTQRAWMQHYSDLRSGALSGSLLESELPTAEELRALAMEFASRGITPITLAELDYHKPDRRLLAAVLRAKREGRAIELPDDPASHLEGRRAFIASALLPERIGLDFSPLPLEHRGLEVRFLLDDRLVITNDPAPPDSINIDFGDGLGPRDVCINEEVDVKYSEPGDKSITLRARRGADELTAGFSFRVRRAAEVPKPDEQWDVTGILPWPLDSTEFGTGPAFVLYGSTDGVKHTSFVKPIIFADGFPGCRYQTPLDRYAEIYELLNARGLMDAILAGGYDAVILSYDDGASYIQRNAMVLISCIYSVNDAWPGEHSFIVAGASMGGLVARYALTFLEHNNVSVQFEMFLSFDAPHEGASIPPSVQWFIQALKYNGNQAAALPADALSSLAAQQMLIYSIPEYPTRPDPQSPQFLRFFEDLYSIGYYPKNPINVAISDGCGDGQAIIPEHAQTLEWGGSFCVEGETWATFNGNLSDVEMAHLYLAPSFESYLDWSGDCINFDGAPGGLSDANGLLAEALINSGYGSVRHAYDRCCFIPAVSAVGLSITSPFTPIPNDGTAVTPFDFYMVSESNLGHVEISELMYGVILDILEIPPSNQGPDQKDNPGKGRRWLSAAKQRHAREAVALK